MEYFLQLVKDGNFKKAEEVIKEVTREYIQIKKEINLTSSHKLDAIDNILACVKNNASKSALKQIDEARGVYNAHIKPFLAENRRVEDKRDQHANRTSQHGAPHGRSEMVDANTPQQRIGTNSSQNNYTGNGAETTLQASKRASQSMRSNNPNIADLSDTNRPTKTAERFSELYDNEWTEAYEEIGNMKTGEKTVIQCLLEIVQKAYRFNEDESRQQLENFEACALAIMKTGKMPNLVKQDNHDQARKDTDWGLLAQYRKDIAGLALERLTKKFVSKQLQDIFSKYKISGVKTTAFAKRCVELTWWMCVQDPPVYMAYGEDNRDFDANLYKAYTKSGPYVDFVVWPALQLYKNGSVLAKGVVQCKATL